MKINECGKEHYNLLRLQELKVRDSKKMKTFRCSGQMTLMVQIAANQGLDR